MSFFNCFKYQKDMKMFCFLKILCVKLTSLNYCKKFFLFVKQITIRIGAIM